MQSSPPEASDVPFHPEVCQRCGTFAPLREFWSRRLCAPCLDREWSALRGEGVGVGGLLTGLGALPLRVWLISAALHCAAGIPTILRTLAGDDSARGLGFEIMADSVASALITYVAVAALLGRDSSLSAAWAAFRPRALAWFVTSFVAGLWVLLMMLLLIVPGIVKALSLALVVPIVLFEPPERARDVLEKSTERMRGARLSALMAYGVFFCLEMIVSVVVSPLLTELAFPGARALAAGLDFAALALGSPTTLLTALLYVRLTPPSAERAAVLPPAETAIAPQSPPA